MSQIQVRQENFSVDYQNERLPELFAKQSIDCDFSSGVLDLIDCGALVAVISQARQTLVIACEQIKETALIQALVKKADSGVRIYLLLGDKKQNHTAIDALSGRCLLRTGVSQTGVLILVDHASSESQGLMLMDHKVLVTVDDMSWGIVLEPQQIDDSFRSFCKLFWEDSDNEYLQQNQPQQKSGHPDGIIVTNHSHQLCGTLKDCLDETLSNLTGVSDFTTENKGGEFNLLLGTNASNIAQVARKGVSLTDNRLPTLLMSESGNWLLPDSPDFEITNWCLRFSDTQSKKMLSVYDQAINDAAWQYEQEVTIGQLPGEQLLRFADQPDLIRLVEKNRSQILGTIITDTIDSFLSDSAESLASKAISWKRDYMAHQIDYQVDIHPPYCPLEAKRDLLYSDWQKTEENWQDRLSSLQHQQKSIDEKQAGLADRLRGFLKGFLLGQGQSVKRLNQELVALQSWSVTEATPAERMECNKRLEDLQANISQRGDDTAEKLDEAEQNHRWEEKRKTLLKLLGEKESGVIAQQDKLKQFVNEEADQQRRVNDAFSIAWKEAVKTLSDSQLKDTKVNDLKPDQFLPDTLPEKEEEQAMLIESANAKCLRKKREVLYSMTVYQGEQWRGLIKDKVWKKYYSAFGKALNNRGLALKKIERNIQDIDKSVIARRSELEHAQSDLDAHGSRFNYQPKKGSKAFDQQLGLKDKPLKSGSFTWPVEELPAEGTELRRLNKQRFLVIADTEQLDLAHNDASRLNAKIVCDQECENA